MRSNSLQKLWFRMRAVARAVLHDLFGEEGSGPGPAPADAGPDSFAEVRSRLDELIPTLAVLTAQQKQVEAELRQTEAALTGLDEAINTAVERGADDEAREKLVKRQPLQQRADALNRRLAESGPLINQLKADIDGMRTRLADAERQARDVAHHEQSAAALERLVRQQRELQRDLNRLQDSLTYRADQAAKVQDRAAARQGIDRRDG